MDSAVANEFDTLAASNTTQSLAPRPVETVSEQSELDKVEAAALSVVHNIEDKMGVIEQTVVKEVEAVEGILVETARKAINIHITAGGGSIVKNPG